MDDESLVQGVREEVVVSALQKLGLAGYVGTELTLKSDQEEANAALKKAVAARRAANTGLVESRVRGSRTSTNIERTNSRVTCCEILLWFLG